MRRDPTLSPETPREREPVGGPQPDSTSSGKPKRKAIPARVQVSVALRQGPCSVMCPLCRHYLYADQPRILEHLTPHATMVALGKDPDAPDNLAWVHAECAARKTNGTPATCASGDLHKIGKAKRLEKAREVHRAVLAGETTREPSRLKGRGFPKVHRPMRRPQP